MGVRARVKNVLALLAAWSLGLWFGINYLAAIAYPELVIGEPPAWVSLAETTAQLAIVGMAACVLGWIALDVRERGISTDRIQEWWPKETGEETEP